MRGPGATLLEAPGQFVLPDFEALAALDLDPEYVLVFNPPWLYSRIWDRLTVPGCWELLTVADWEAGNSATDDRALFAPRTTPQVKLATWAARVLGHPVTLEAHKVEIKTDSRFARWHAVPLYWVRRNT